MPGPIRDTINRGGFVATGEAEVIDNAITESAAATWARSTGARNLGESTIFR